MKEMLCQLKKALRLQQHKKSWRFIAHKEKKFKLLFVKLILQGLTNVFNECHCYIDQNGHFSSYFLPTVITNLPYDIFTK